MANQEERLSDERLAEAIDEAEKKVPWEIHVDSVREHAYGYDSEESRRFFEGCRNEHVKELVMLLRLQRSREIQAKAWDECVH